MSVFDGLPDIFTETFGESVVYTPVATGTPATINAIVIHEPIQVVLGEGASADDLRKELHVRAEDIASPAEGDTAVIGGVTWNVVTPIRPDGRGMIALTLAK